jgi:hypothetical protein
MKSLYLVLITFLVAGMSFAQTSIAQQNAASAPEENASRFVPGTELRIELEKTVDAKKAKAGDPVLAKTMDELKSGTQLIAPRGAKIIGHVVAAAPHEKNSPSSLEVAFDKLEVGNGSEIPLKASIQALEKPVYNPSMPTSDNTGQPMGGNSPMSSGSRMGGMTPGGASQPSGGSNPGNPGAMPNQSAPSTISPNAEGVIGMSGVSLSAGPAQDSVLTSEKHNVKLDSGTQMILRVQ